MNTEVDENGGNAISRIEQGVDPITAEIFRYALTAIPSQIDGNIVSTAYSPLVYEYKDYAVGIVDHEGRLISQSRGALPIFVANALGVAVRDGLETYGRDGIAPGDILFSNHAGTLGQHLNNVVMYSPIFIAPDQSDLFGFMAVIIHWVDVGGDGAGRPLSATDIFQEGVQYRSLKLWRAGEPDCGLYRTIQSNTRFPRDLMGDLEAQLAGCVRGAELVRDLVRKYGHTTARAAVHRLWDRAEAGARAAIREIPNGEYHANALLDDNGLPGGPPVPVSVVVRINGETMEVDLSGCGDQAAGPINSGREGGAVAAARIAFKYLIEPSEPANDGAFRALQVTIRDGTFLSARGDAPMHHYSLPLPTVIDAILRAVADAVPSSVAAGHHGAFGAHVFSGMNARTGERFQCFDTALGGWGATEGRDGGGPFKTMAHGDTLDVPVEVMERLYPIKIESWELRQDSGGPGKFRGGLGTTRVYIALAPFVVSIAQDREKTPPWGLFGGLDGAAPETYLVRKGEQPTRIRRGVLVLEPGDRLIAHAGGGGGFGDPYERDPLQVCSDVSAGYVTRKAAHDYYGIMFGPEANPLAKETTGRRRLAPIESPEPGSSSGDYTSVSIRGRSDDRVVHDS